jgi:hypothetical protein
MTTEEVKHKLDAILSADSKLYSRLMLEDEEQPIMSAKKTAFNFGFYFDSV